MHQYPMARTHVPEIFTLCVHIIFTNCFTVLNIWNRFALTIFKKKMKNEKILLFGYYLQSDPSWYAFYGSVFNMFRRTNFHFSSALCFG